MKTFATSAALLIVLLAAACPAHAYKFSPISQVFAPSGSEATQAYEVANDGKERIAVEISITSLERDENYLETNHDAGDDFLIFPPQIILAAGARQTVRVTWLGAPALKLERAFRIVVTEVPIESLGGAATPGAPVAKGQMRILLTYRGTIFVRPVGATAKLALGQAEAATAPDGGRSLAIMVENRGEAGATLTGCKIRVSAAGTALDLPATTVAPMNKLRVLAGSRRRFLLAWPAGLPVGPVVAVGACAFR